MFRVRYLTHNIQNNDDHSTWHSEEEEESQQSYYSGGVQENKYTDIVLNN